MPTATETPIQLVLKQFTTLSRSDFAEWLANNSANLLLLEKNELRQAYLKGVENYSVPQLKINDAPEFSFHQHWKEEEGFDSPTIKHFQ